MTPEIWTALAGIALAAIVVGLGLRQVYLVLRAPVPEPEPEEPPVNSNGDVFPDDLIRRVMSNPGSRRILATAMVNPIRNRLDYQGLGRRLIAVDPLPEAASTLLPGATTGIQPGDTVQGTSEVAQQIREDSIRAVSMGTQVELNQDFQYIRDQIQENLRAPEPEPVTGERVTVPTFDGYIAPYTAPMVRIADVRERRFNSYDRATQQARQEIMAQEDQRILDTLDELAEAGGSLFPEWAVMGCWVRNQQTGTVAQVVDAHEDENFDYAVLELWEGYEYLPETLDCLKVSPEGYVSVTDEDVIDFWVPSGEPVVHPTIWEHLDDLQELD
jgi:hypothetical protein